MWQHESEDGTRVICDLCPRHCALRPGDRGFCFVRENRDGRVVSTTYGRSTGFCVDPIEKKPLNQFYPGTPVLSFGTPGCNLGCKFCQNWTMSRSRDVEAACEEASPEAIADAAARLHCRSVAFTYNDPIIWAEYAIDTAKACHAVGGGGSGEGDSPIFAGAKIGTVPAGAKIGTVPAGAKIGTVPGGVKTVAVTSGYISDTARAAFYEPMDAANVDLKGFTDEFYRDYCAGHLQPVLDTLRWLVHETQTWVEITNLIIPGANDSPAEIERMCRWIAAELRPDVPLHFSAFHPDFKVTDRGPTPPIVLQQAYDIARAAGLHYVYTGNVYDPEHQHTYCPGCGRAIIRRDGYTLSSFEIKGGRCVHCQTPIAGRFDDAAGTWGGRRMPVRIQGH